jgi:hypothetical protein
MNVSFQWKGKQLLRDIHHKEKCVAIDTGDTYITLLAVLSCACKGIPVPSGLQVFYSFVGVIAQKALSQVPLSQRKNPYAVTLAIWEALRDNLKCSKERGKGTEKYKYTLHADNFISDLVHFGMVNCAGGSALLVHTVLTLFPQWHDQIGYVFEPGHVLVWAHDTFHEQVVSIETTKRNTKLANPLPIQSSRELKSFLDPDHNDEPFQDSLNSYYSLILPSWVGDLYLFIQNITVACPSYSEFLRQVPRELKGEHTPQWNLVLNLLTVLSQTGKNSLETITTSMDMLDTLFPNKWSWQKVKDNMLQLLGIPVSRKMQLVRDMCRHLKWCSMDAPELSVHLKEFVEEDSIPTVATLIQSACPNLDYIALTKLIPPHAMIDPHQIRMMQSINDMELKSQQIMAMFIKMQTEEDERKENLKLIDRSNLVARFARFLRDSEFWKHKHTPESLQDFILRLPLPAVRVRSLSHVVHILQDSHIEDPYDINTLIMRNAEVFAGLLYMTESELLASKF